jgi:hypothetical protein
VEEDIKRWRFAPTAAVGRPPKRDSKQKENAESLIERNVAPRSRKKFSGLVAITFERVRASKVRWKFTRVLNASAQVNHG